MERRDFLKAAAFTTAGALAGPTLLQRAGTMLAPPALAASGGTLFGASAQVYGGKSREQLIQYLEGLAGAKFDTVQNRFGWTTSLVNSYSRWIVQTGHTPILSWSTHGGGDVPWSQIAKGAHDARLRAEAAEIAAAGWDAYLIFHKEPEDEPNLGTAADYRNAHDRAYEIFQQEGATRVRFVANLMAATYKGRNGGASTWLPPRFDIAGVDGYNRNKSGSWRSFESIFRPALQVAQDRSKPLYVIESGCVEGSPGQKGDWFREAAATAATWSELIGISYNHESGSGNYRVDTSTTSIAGFHDLVHHAAFGGAGSGAGGGGGSGGGGGGGGGDTCEVPREKLAKRREQVRDLRHKLRRQRRKTRRLRERLQG